MEDKISIIITCYNLEKYIKQCIESICNQSYTNLEIIVIDDGSEDNSSKIVKSFMSIDSRVRLIEQKNSGVSHARNMGLQAVTGKYLMFIDGDDTIGKTYIEDIYNGIENDCDLVIAGLSFVYPNGDKRVIEGIEFSCSKEEFQDKYFLEETSRRLIFGPVNKLYNRKLIEEYNIQFDEKIEIREDGMFVLNFLEKVKYVCGVKTAEYFYIQHPLNTSLVSKFHSAEKDINKSFFEKLVKTWGENNIDNEGIEKVYPMFLNMNITSIRKLYNSNQYSLRKGLKYIKNIVTDDFYTSLRKDLLRVNIKKALKYYRPIIVMHLINYFAVKRWRKR